MENSDDVECCLDCDSYRYRDKDEISDGRGFGHICLVLKKQLKDPKKIDKQCPVY